MSFRTQKLPTDLPPKIRPQKVILATNDESLSYAKLILDLLNALSIWFGLGLLNLPVYLASIRRLFALLGQSLARLGKSGIERR